jgi:hypothetical protein
MPSVVIGQVQRTPNELGPTTSLHRFRQCAKRWLPFFLQEGLRTIEDATRFRLYQPGHLKLWLRDWLSHPAVRDRTERANDVYQRALLGWLGRAQDALPGGGVAAYYGLAEGWSAAYPETTGYIIVTCLEAAKRLCEPALAARARRMADWELEVQLPGGAWQSGLATAPRVPAVFNTGQVIQGLLSAYDVFGDTAYLEAAVRGGRWLVDHQDPDGAWRQYTYNDFPNTYSTRVAWPLLTLAHATGERAFSTAATRYLYWASHQQDETGWLAQCSLEVGDPPLTHTLAYAIEGFIESGGLLGDERWIAVGERTADALLRRFEIRRQLVGTYDRGWRGDFAFACLTGCAQMSKVWGRLFELRGDARYINGALKLNDFLVSLIDLDSACAGIRGGIKGSHPLWGAYMSWRLPSWAVKFTLDALFQEDDALALLRGKPSEHHDPLQLYK